MVSHKDDFIIFGGKYGASDETSVIAKYDLELNKWSKLGNMKNARFNFGVIRLGTRWWGDDFLVAGGLDYLKTEMCKLNNDRMVCSEQAPTLQRWW